MSDVEKAEATGSPLEVFRVFLRLGLTSFGGPIAHLGYFHNELVLRRRWIDEETYVQLVALCQFLPGPASSQVGFSLGLLRGNGLLGGLAAWAAFTLPSALILLAFALGANAFTGPAAEGFIHGLKLVAVAVVAQAVWGMAQNLTPDRPRAAIALCALFLVILASNSWAQIAAIALGAIGGLLLCRDDSKTVRGALRFPVSRRDGAISLALFTGFLLLPPVIAAATGDHTVRFFDAFFRSGALVFGGGHVVLPLLQNAVVAPGLVHNQDFLAGYGLAQAVPGPLFTFAAYIGAVAVQWPNGTAGAFLALFAIFLPGLMLVYGTLPYWDELRSRPGARAAMKGANAAVVGILAAALYNPVWTSAVLAPRDFAIATAGFLLLTVWKLPSWSVVGLLAVAGLIASVL
ncbi:chromate efflux transporter [Hyphomicrobium sp. ghe19]|uniref:chromate efflux transporter n=1 Tax=Hyphomicrobium sp. ghe19 TaxID=2682968 RepID=UPI001366865A|nr:putative chromate transport protein [Hyphomicrobium sp. ghe19]